MALAQSVHEALNSSFGGGFGDRVVCSAGRANFLQQWHIPNSDDTTQLLQFPQRTYDPFTNTYVDAIPYTDADLGRHVRLEMGRMA